MSNPQQLPPTEEDIAVGQAPLISDDDSETPVLARTKPANGAESSSESSTSSYSNSPVPHTLFPQHVIADMTLPPPSLTARHFPLPSTRQHHQQPQGQAPAIGTAASSESTMGEMITTVTTSEATTPKSNKPQGVRGLGTMYTSHVGLLTATQTPRHIVPATSANTGATSQYSADNSIQPSAASNFVQQRLSAIRVANNNSNPSGGAAMFCSIALDDAAMASDFFGPQLESVGICIGATPSPQRRPSVAKDGLLGLVPFPMNNPVGVKQGNHGVGGVSLGSSAGGYFSPRRRSKQHGAAIPSTLHDSISISYASSASSNSPCASHSRNPRGILGASSNPSHPVQGGGGASFEALQGVTYATTTSSSGGGGQLGRFVSSTSTHSTVTAASVAVPHLSAGAQPPSKPAANAYLEGTVPNGGRVMIATPCPIGPSRSANRSAPQRSQSDNTALSASTSNRANNVFTSVVPSSSLGCHSVPTTSAMAEIAKGQGPSSCPPLKVTPPAIFSTGTGGAGGGSQGEQSIMTQPYPSAVTRIRSGAHLRATAKVPRQLQVSISDPVLGSDSTVANATISSMAGTLGSAASPFMTHGAHNRSSRSQWISVINEGRLDLSSITSLAVKVDGVDTPSTATTPTNANSAEGSSSSPNGAASRRMRFVGGTGFSAASALLSRSGSPTPIVGVAGVSSPTARFGHTFSHTRVARNFGKNVLAHPSTMNNSYYEQTGNSLAKDFLEQYAKRKGCDVVTLATVIVNQQQQLAANKKGSSEASLALLGTRQQPTTVGMHSEEDDGPSSFQALNFSRRRTSDETSISLHTGVTASSTFLTEKEGEMSNNNDINNNSTRNPSQGRGVGGGVKQVATPPPHSAASLMVTDSANLSTSRENYMNAASDSTSTSGHTIQGSTPPQAKEGFANGRPTWQDGWSPSLGKVDPIIHPFPWPIDHDQLANPTANNVFQSSVNEEHRLLGRASMVGHPSMLGSSLVTRANSNGRDGELSTNSQSLQPLTPNLSHKTAAAAPSSSVAWGTVSDSSTASSLLTTAAATEDHPTAALLVGLHHLSKESCQSPIGTAGSSATSIQTRTAITSMLVAPIVPQQVHIPLPSPHQLSLKPIRGSSSRLLAATTPTRAAVQPLPPITTSPSSFRFGERIK